MARIGGGATVPKIASIAGDTRLYEVLRDMAQRVSAYVNDVFNSADARVSELEAIVMRGYGSPENVVTASVGKLYLRRDGGAGTTLYVKESGTGNTGWVGK